MPVWCGALLACVSRPVLPKLYLPGIGVYAFYALYKVYDANGLIGWITGHDAQNIAGTMKAEEPRIEETREFFGLLILIGVLLVDYLHAKRKLRNAEV